MTRLNNRVAKFLQSHGGDFKAAIADALERARICVEEGLPEVAATWRKAVRILKEKRRAA